MTKTSTKRSGTVVLAVKTTASRHATEAAIKAALVKMNAELARQGIEIAEVHAQGNLEQEGIDY